MRAPSNMVQCFDMAEGVLFDILLYLPIMSLLRFKTVCKSWCSMIESRTFVIQHLDCHDEEDALISRSPFRSESEQFYLHYGRHYEKNVYIDFDELHWHPAATQTIYLCGSCNGIICLTIELDIALWNPALKQVRPLPMPLFCGRYKEVHLYTRDYFMFGIGSRARDDYKVVSIALFYSSHDYLDDCKKTEMVGNHVEVYSLRENSWRTIYEDDALPFWDLVIGKGVSSSKRGKCFWIAEDVEFSPILVSFDFNDEVFATMSFPDYRHYDEAHGFHLLSVLDIIHNETLVLIKWLGDNPDNSGQSFELWMLHEFGVQESCTRIYKVDFSYVHPVLTCGLSWNGEFLISLHWNDYLNSDYMLHMHNLSTQEGTFLPISPSRLVMHHKPSLISIKSANGEV